MRISWRALGDRKKNQPPFVALLGMAIVTGREERTGRLKLVDLRLQEVLIYFQAF